MRLRVCLLSFCVALVQLGSAASAVTMEWTAVGNPGNACDVQPQGCFGAVGYSYAIGTYEVARDMGLAVGNATIVIQATFASPEDLQTYVDHPAHQAMVAEHIAPRVADRAAVQFALGD